MASDKPITGLARRQHQVIHIRHPGYDDSCNKLLTLYAVDHPDGGVHYETARTACGILAGNRWDGVFTLSPTFSPEDVLSGPYLVGKDAYFHLPDWQPDDPDDPDAQLKRRYPIYVRWEEWDFPHGNLPQIWQDVMPHPDRIKPMHPDHRQKLAPATEDQDDDKDLAELVHSMDALASVCDPQGGDMASAVQELKDSLLEASSEKAGGEAPAEPQQTGGSTAPSTENASNDTPARSISPVREGDPAMQAEPHVVRNQQIGSVNAVQQPSDPPKTKEELVEELVESQMRDPQTSWLLEEAKDWCQLCNKTSNATAWALAPKQHPRWFQRNRMWQYTEFEPKSDEEYKDIDTVRDAQTGFRGTLRLEENCLGERHNVDVAYALIQGQWVFAPKFEWCGKPRIVAQLFVPQFEKYDSSIYWDQGIDASRDNPLLRPDRVSLEMLFVRFAQSVWYSLGDFLQAGVDRLLLLANHKGTVKPRQVSDDVCKHIYRQTHLIMPQELWEESLLFHDENFYLVCDGCHMNFAGVRFKCLEDENFDYCSECIKSADTTHPDHSFIRLHEKPPDNQKQPPTAAGDEEIEGQVETKDNDDLQVQRSRSSSFSSVESEQNGESEAAWQDFLRTGLDERLGAMAYTALPAPTDDQLMIRLLVLWPGEKWTPLQCHLVATNIKDAPPFEALSYCWGDETTKTTIMVNGGRLKVTRNLKSALHHLRSLNEARVLWADAVCINQDDKVEKAGQVSRMADVYRHAQRTIVWLGEETDKSGKVLRMCRRILKERGRAFWTYILGVDFSRLERSKDELREAFKSLENSLETEASQDMPVLGSMPGVSDGENVVSTREEEDIGDMLKSQVRHLMASGGPLSLFGLVDLLGDSNDENGLQLPSGAGAEAASEIQPPADDDRTIRDNAVLEGQLGGSKKFPHLLALLALFRREWFRRVWIIQEVAVAPKAIVKCGNEQVDWWLLFWAIIALAIQSEHRNLLMLEPGVMTFMNISRQIVSVKSDAWGQGDEVISEELMSILQLYRRFKATDPRDKVYALLGLLPPSAVEKKLVSVDYVEPVGATYARAAMSCIAAGKSLDLLATPKPASRSDLPLFSWVPDWSYTERLAQLLDSSLYNPSISGNFNATRGSQIVLDGTEFKPSDGTFRLTGYPIEKLKTVCKVLTLPETEIDILGYQDILQKTKADDSLMNIITEIVDMGKRIIGVVNNFANAADEWHALALGNGNLSYPTGEDRLDVYIRTLAADTYPHGWTAAVASFNDWQQRMQLIRDLSRDLSKDLPDDPKNVFEVLPWFKTVVDTFTSGALSTTPQESGSILKKHEILSKAFMRALGMTENGCLALLPAGARPGDTVVLLEGGKTPYILREAAVGWEFIGDAYVDGIMHGEAWDETKCHEVALV